jgi:hypothetical protein
MLLVLFALYVIIGIAYNTRERNLQGKEAIPHIEFWREFPSLIQDGLAFSLVKGKQFVEFTKSKIAKKNSAYDDL